MSRSPHPPRNSHLQSWERVAKSPNTRTTSSLYSMPQACGGDRTRKVPHPCHLPIHATALPLGIVPALSALAGEGVAKAGEQSRCAGRKLMQQIVKQPSSPGLRAGHGPGKRASCLLPAGTGRVEAHPRELGSEMLLAEALPDKQGSSSADAATSSTGSQQSAHWCGRLPVPAVLWEDPLQRSRWKFRSSFIEQNHQIV